MTEFDSFDGREDGEHTGVGFVGTLKYLQRRNAVSFGTESFDSLQYEVYSLTAENV